MRLYIRLQHVRENCCAIKKIKEQMYGIKNIVAHADKCSNIITKDMRGNNSTEEVIKNVELNIIS